MTAGDWRPRASLRLLRMRAEVLARIRAFFAEAGVLEVETPILSRAAVTAPELASLRTRFHGPGPAAGSCYLQTSPEFPMKRLLAAGSGSIYQLCKVFRDGERGRRHHPEFSLLEWYRVGWTWDALMDEVEALLGRLCPPWRPPPVCARISYRNLFLHHTGVDGLEPAVAPWQDCLQRAGIQVEGLPADDAAPWRDLVLTHLIEPRLEGALFVYDYPPEQAALARVEGEPPVARRFELYLDGMELANGYQELTDAAEQARRFARERAERRRQGLAEVPADERLLAALAAGLPECAGVALGLDRLLMYLARLDRIDQVLAFPLERA